MSQYVDPYETPKTLPPAYTGSAPSQNITVIQETNIEVEVNKREPQVVVQEIVHRNDSGMDVSVGCCLGCLCSMCCFCTVM
jgi:hypothetical protein